MGRLLVIPLALIALLAAAIVWSGGGHEDRADFAFINRGDINTLDLNQMSYLQDFRMAYAMWEGLFMYDPQTLEPFPGCASSVDITTDKRSYTFHIRPEAKWSDGTPVIAKDFVFAWRRMLESPAEYTYLHYYIKGAEKYRTDYDTYFTSIGEYMDWVKKQNQNGRKIDLPEPLPVPFKPKESDAPAIVPLPDFATVGLQTPDPLTLKVSLEDPTTFFLDLVAFGPFYPLHEKSMEKFKVSEPNGRVRYDQEFTRPPNIVTNGAYKLTDWDFKRRLFLRQNEYYWDRANVKSKTIEMVVVEDVLTQLKRYDFGKVDWLSDVPSELAAELKASGRKDMHVFPGFGTIYLNVNCLPTFKGGAKNPFNDVRVRQALAMSIEKRIICDSITRMGETPAEWYIPPGIFPGYTSKPGLKYDIAGAKKLLADAGYADGKGFPRITMLFRSDRQVTKETVQNLAKQWKDKLGIEMELEAVEGKISRKRVNEQDYMICPGSWIGDYGDPSTFTDKYRSNSENNDSKWKSQEFDDLVAKASKEPDAQKRMLQLQRAEEILNNEAPIIPLYYLVNAYMFRDNVTGLNLSPRNTIIFKAVHVDRK